MILTKAESDFFRQNLPFSFPILIADIGGTNARFACLFTSKKRHYYKKQITKYFHNIDQMIEEFIYPMLDQKPKSLVLAMAGPIEGEEMKLTNCHWVIKPKALIKKFGFESVLLLNDFEAQALATVALDASDFYPIDKEGQKKSTENFLSENSTKVILGPGTGLGVTALLFNAGHYIPIPGEGGHINYAPQNRIEFLLYPYLCQDKARLSAEDLLSGRGLIRIYKAFCRYYGKEISDVDGEKISYLAQEGDQLAQESLSFFIDYLARFAGDLALIFKAEGGVYIGGGIMPQLLSFLDKVRFRAFFENKFPHQKILAKIPIYLMQHPDPALEGLAYFLSHPEKFSLMIEQRLWQK